MEENKTTFAEKHPKLNFLVGVILLLIIVAIGIVILLFIYQLINKGIDSVALILTKMVSTTDKVIVVAMITGSVSILGVVISSIIAKIVDYRFNVKKYLYDKREVPYEQFIDMVYRIMEDAKKPKEKRMSQEETISMVSEFSKGLTLWGSNRVAKSGLNIENNVKQEILRICSS